MALERMPESPLVRSLHRSFAVITVAGILLGVFFLALVHPDPGTLWMYTLPVVVFWMFSACGLLAWYRRPRNGMGPLLVAGGFATLLGSLGDLQVPVLVAVGAVTATSVFAVTFHLLLAFPTGRLVGQASKLTVAAGYVVSLVLQAPLYLFSPTRFPGAWVLADRPDWVAIGEWVQRAGGLAVTLATVVILVGHLRRGNRQQQQVMIPLYSYAIFTVLFESLSGTLWDLLMPQMPELRGVVQMAVLAGVPIAFALSVLRGGFAQTSELEELGGWLGSADTTRPAITQAVARVLGDSSLRVLFWIDEHGAFADADGRPAALEPAPSRGRAEIVLHGRPVGALDYDSTLVDDPQLAKMAARVVAIAVDRDRLMIELRASRDALYRSRFRIVEAEDEGRRRLALDLHDGLQVQLVLLAVKAGQLARSHSVAEGLARQAEALRQDIDGAAESLRRFVHSVMPAPLIGQGLPAATEDLVDRMPLPTSLEITIDDLALPKPIESTAYFVIAEGLANALKHAAASACGVRLTRSDDRLVVEVADDGVGGASLSNGTGLRGLADRVDTLGGTIHVESQPGTGTLLRAELPCGS
ncbi:sensor histidine kinase [Humibacter antri]